MKTIRGENDNDPAVLVFAQLDRFSYTNDAINSFLPSELDDFKVENIRVYRKIVTNPILLLICIFGLIRWHGFGVLRHGRRINTFLFKTPTFFWLASWYVQRYARSIKNVRAVLQTQAFFNAKLPHVPLYIYIDNTILNKINDHYELCKRTRAIIELEKQLYASARNFLVTAGHVRDSLSEDYGVPTGKINVVLIGANSPRVTPQAGRYLSRHILFVGIDWERKGGPTLVTAFQSALKRFPDARLTIVGSSPDIDHPNITVLGRTEPAVVSRLMGECAIYCMPSVVEPSSVAVIEAARAGLPVVGTNTGGFLDSVVDGATGFLVAPHDHISLAVDLETLLDNPALCQKMGNAGRRHVSKFAWPLVCSKIADTISGVDRYRQRPMPELEELEPVAIAV